MNDQKIEQEIQAKGLTAPRIAEASRHAGQLRARPRQWNRGSTDNTAGEPQDA